MDTAYGHRPSASRLPTALRAPFSGRTWRELLYLVLSLPLSTVMFGYAVTMISLSAGLLVTFLGIPVLAGALVGCRGMGAWSGSGRAPCWSWTWPTRSRCAPPSRAC